MLAASALLLLASSTSTHAQLLADAASGGAEIDADGARDLCDGVDLLGPAVDLLRGKHIRVLETTWFPFAVPNEAAPHGWSGFDIDLLSAVSEYLGFTFEVTEGGPLLEDETCVSRARLQPSIAFFCAPLRGRSCSRPVYVRHRLPRAHGRDDRPVGELVDAHRIPHERDRHARRPH